MDHTQYTTNGAERKPGTHLTMEDRGAIQAMKKLGHSNRAIIVAQLSRQKSKIFIMN